MTKKIKGIRKMAKKIKVDELRVYNNPKDYGKDFRTMEVAVNWFLNPQMVYNGCKGQDKVDIVIYSKIDGTRLNIESKGGSGVLVYSVEDIVNIQKPATDYIDMVFPKTNYVVYSPQYNGIDNLGNTAFVFTRDEFIAFLTGYTTKTGKPADLIRYKTSTKGHLDITMQSFNSSVKQDYLYDTLATMPTLEEWREDWQNGLH